MAEESLTLSVSVLRGLGLVAHVNAVRKHRA